MNRHQETGDRHVENLLRLMGERISELLAEEDVTDINFNPPKPGERDGTLWVIRHGRPKEAVGTMSVANAEALIGAVASTMGNAAQRNSPIVDGVLLTDRSRFWGAIDPIVEGAAFAIRKKAKSVIPLSTYVQRGQMTVRQMERLESAICNRENMLISGGTGSGKTTLMDACIHSMVRLKPDYRIVTIQDTDELRCGAEDCLSMLTSSNITMRDLLKAALRALPTVILIGEVRGPETLDMLMAWNTGHPGSIATIHSNIGDPRSALRRAELLVGFTTQAPMQKLVAETVHLIVCIGLDKNVGRRVTQIASVKGYDAAKDEYNIEVDEA
jgi:P-type conjugative transfer ATPase TrbB